MGRGNARNPLGISSRLLTLVTPLCEDCQGALSPGLAPGGGPGGLGTQQCSVDNLCSRGPRRSTQGNARIDNGVPRDELKNDRSRVWAVPYLAKKLLGA